MFDIADLLLQTGDVVEHRVTAAAPEYRQAGTTYRVDGDEIELNLAIAAYDGGYELHLTGSVTLEGPCARCLEAAATTVVIDLRDLHEPGSNDDDLRSPFVNDDVELDVSAWAQSAVALEFPHRVLCQEDCQGLCPQCGVNWNDEDCECEPEVDTSRWEKLREISFGDPAEDGADDGSDNG